MLNQIYSVLKTQLTTVERLRLVTRWNNQLQTGIIHDEPACFIDFPNPSPMRTMNRQIQEGDLTITIHLCGRILREQDGSVDDTLVAEIEDVANEIYGILQGFGYDMSDNEGLMGSMDREEYFENTTEPGWIDIEQTFVCEIYQQQVTTRYSPAEKPPPEIISELESPIPN
jgi:hypothetical protein